MSNDDPPPLATLYVSEEEQQFLRVAEDGGLEIPLSLARKISDWVRRYDLRPSSQRTVVAREPSFYTPAPRRGR